VADAVAVGLHRLVVDAVRGEAGQDVVEVRHAECDHGAVYALGPHLSIVDDDQGFSPTCYRYSSPITSSGGRPKNTPNHRAAASRSRTQTTLYRSISAGSAWASYR
jgi:hypothetical protein